MIEAMAVRGEGISLLPPENGAAIKRPLCLHDKHKNKGRLSDNDGSVNHKRGIGANMAKPRGPNQQTSEATRQRILDAAAMELAEKAGREDPFQGIALARVAHRAGISRNGLANHYPTKDAFNRALAAHLLATETVWPSEDVELQNLLDPTRFETPLDAIRTAVRADLRFVVSTPSWVAIERVTLAAGKDPTLQKLAVTGYRADDVAQWERVLAPLLSRLGHSVSAERGRVIAAMYNALLEGAAIRCIVDDEFRSQVFREESGPLFEAYIGAQLHVLTGLSGA